MTDDGGPVKVEEGYRAASASISHRHPHATSTGGGALTRARELSSQWIPGGRRRIRSCGPPPGRAPACAGPMIRNPMCLRHSHITRTNIGRDTKGAKTRFIAPAYGKFESSSLQQTVRLSRDFSFLYRKAGSCRGCAGPARRRGRKANNRQNVEVRRRGFPATLATCRQRSMPPATTGEKGHLPRTTNFGETWAVGLAGESVRNRLAARGNGLNYRLAPVGCGSEFRRLLPSNPTKLIEAGEITHARNRDRRFESISLQQRVCKRSVPRSCVPSSSAPILVSRAGRISRVLKPAGGVPCDVERRVVRRVLGRA
jgi:hypothetical protein